VYNLCAGFRLCISLAVYHMPLLIYSVSNCIFYRIKCALSVVSVGDVRYFPSSYRNKFILYFSLTASFPGHPG